MEKKTHSAQFLRKRRFVMVLPLLVLPFITLMFWSLGGGQGSTVAGQTAKDEGLNLSLPSARIVDEGRLDKLGFYEQAEIDSAKLRELKKTDPYYRNGLEGNPPNTFSPDTNPVSSLRPLTGEPDPNEARVYQKLAELNKQLNQPAVDHTERQINNQLLTPGSNSRDADKLEALMQTMKRDNTQDAEMQQLNETLEKIMDIQHPERVKQRAAGEQVDSRHYKTSTNQNKVAVSLLEPRGKLKSITRHANMFYGSIDSLDTEATSENGIRAVVYTNQTLVNGSVIKLKLLDELTIGNHVIPQGVRVYGTVQLNDQRLFVNIASIKKSNTIYPVTLTLYDLDGLEGLYIPGAISRDVAKESSANALQTIELSTMNPSVSAQATNAGLSAFRSLLTRKAKLVKVTVKDGYQIILQDKSTN